MEINMAASVRVEMAAGVIPVLYVEDFYCDPDAVRAQGLKASFDQSVAFYPGRHATLETPESRKVVEHICALLSALGDSYYEPSTAITDFSILTTKASNLLGKQKHPHIDPTPVLGIIYLNPHTTQGTCLFRNRILGTHVVIGPEQNKAHQDFLEQHGETYEPATYDVSDNAAWEKLYTIEGRFNRLVVYPGNVFHSIDLQDVPDTFDINTTRLTQRIIVQHLQLKAAAVAGD